MKITVKVFLSSSDTKYLKEAMDEGNNYFLFNYYSESTKKCNHTFFLSM